MRDNSARTWRVLSTYLGMTSYYTVKLQAWRVHCPIRAQIRLVIANHVRELFYSFDNDNNNNNNNNNNNAKN